MRVLLRSCPNGDQYVWKKAEMKDARTLFDCNSERAFDISEEDLKHSEWEDYEIGGMDIFYDEKRKSIHIEFNIEIDEEEM